LLVSHGASSIIVNKGRNTAMDVARMEGHMEVSDFLRAQRTKETEDLAAASC
jgi:hypothetical protein